MRVLIVCSYKSQLQEGCVPFIREQVEALRTQGCECEYYHIKGKGLLGYLREISGLRKKIGEWKPDVIHAHYGLSCLVANLATRRVPVVSTYHGSDINVSSVRRFSQIAIRLSAWNIFVSQLNVEIAQPKKRWSLVPCGVELSDGQLQSRAEARKVLGWSADEKKVLFAGAFDNDVKQPELAKAVIAYLNREENSENNGENRENIIITKKEESEPIDISSNNLDPKSAQKQAFGQPSAQSCSVSLTDSSEKNNSKNAKNSHADENIELIELKGYNRQHVNTLMCASNCLFMTSKTEGSPQVIKEAMACGCPIVSVDVGDVAERTEGVDGCFVVKSREPREIAEALKKAIVYDGKTNGREKILEYGLSNEMIAQKIIDIYKKICIDSKK